MAGMQTNSDPNRFLHAGGRPKSLLHGKKAVAQQSSKTAQPQAIYYAPVILGQPQAPTRNIQPQGLLGKLWHMISEEASPERPIGISQMASSPFKASKDGLKPSYFRNGQAIQDYRFNHKA
jgi:hypothetical protein